jgi:hypothetical protein
MLKIKKKISDEERLLNNFCERQEKDGNKINIKKTKKKLY